MTSPETTGRTTASPPPSDGPGFTAVDVAAKALELCEAQPEFVYDPPDRAGNCLYVYDGQPSCLFGQALVALGADPLALAVRRNDSITAIVDDFGLTAEKDYFLEKAQVSQDTGYAWGSEYVAGHLRTFLRESA